MSKGYWIARVDVRNPDGYPKYVETAKPAFERFGAKFLVRGGKANAIEGPGRARNVVIEFPSYADAIACYDSPEYQAAKALRDPVSEGDLVIIEGYDA